MASQQPQFYHFRHPTMFYHFEEKDSDSGSDTEGTGSTEEQLFPLEPIGTNDDELETGPEIYIKGKGWNL